MFYSDTPLTLIEAIDRARTEGLAADVLAGLAEHAHELLISLDTVDPDPTLSIRKDRSRAAELISGRSQSGPERWEYPYSITEYRDHSFLRVSGGGEIVDVPVLPAIFGMVERYGLVEDVALSAPVRVDRRKFENAIAQLTRSGDRAVLVP